MTDQEIANLCRRLADMLEDDVNGGKTVGWYQAVSKLATQLHTTLGEVLEEEQPS